MLKSCLRLAIHAEHETGGVKVEVELRPDGVGHRVPTGFVDRHLVLVVEAFNADGQPMGPAVGPRLPLDAGKALADRSGKLFAKLLKDHTGHSPAPFWQADPEPTDTRLTAGIADHSAYLFSSDTKTLRARVLYRRFWQEVAEVKRWPDSDIVVAEQQTEVERSDVTR